MTGGWTRAVGATLMLVASPAAAENIGLATSGPGPEIAVGVLAHGIGFGEPFYTETPPAGAIFEGQEERGTADVQLIYRTAPLPIALALRPRLAGRLQFNTGGKTSFASIGAEWRQDLLHGRLYGQVGIGLATHDGYDFTPNPFEPGLPREVALSRYRVYRTRTAFGSRVLFNPNLSLGVRLTDRWAVEVAWEHFSHAQLFSRQNSGNDTAGLRFVRSLGR